MRWDIEVAWVASLTALVSVFSFLLYWRDGSLLLYGDAVAHINIARRVFDSRTPGPLQLGTVWLPLPHLAMMPFLVTNWTWQTGVGGSIPSLIAFVFGAIGIFRLVRASLNWRSQPEPMARLAAWLGVIIYSANPNLIYLQTTAMTEPLYLACFIWAIVHLNEFAQTSALRDAREYPEAASSLCKCGLCVAAACLTRYDGWFLAACVMVFAVITIIRGGRSQFLSREWKKLVLAAALVPTLWLGYNAIIYRNPLEFANGPYSAKAIEQRSANTGTVVHPGSNDLVVSGSYFLKAAEANLAVGGIQKLWVLLALAGTALALVFYSRFWPLLLLWLPLPFYALSVAYGGVPIFIPDWWPFSFYNVRYGLQLLPAFAVFVALLPYYLSEFAKKRIATVVVALSAVVFVSLCYWQVWRIQPICFREAWVNSRTRNALERELAGTLGKLPRDATLLMYLGDHVGAVQRAGIPLHSVIYEGNHRTWKQPSDPEGLWEKALADPSSFADYVVAIDGDPVANAVLQHSLVPIAEIHATGQPSAIVYSTRRPTPR
ncbi:MAG TPA: hypothetical protein VH437_05580 [Terriglobales bacterium]